MFDELSVEQICTHYGEERDKNRGAVVTPIFQTSSYSLDSDYEYTRGNVPNFEVVERKLAALDHAEDAVLVSSGCSAAAAVLHATLKAGDHVVAVRASYPGSRQNIEALEPMGITHTYIQGKTIEEFEAAILPNTRLIYLESPSSFVFEIQPLEEVVALAKSKGIYTAIDNTCATPLYQNPLDWGIDLIVYSASKYFGGHADVVAGVVVGSGELIKRVRKQRGVYGWITSPLNAWLIERGLRTLPVRVPAISRNARAVVKYMESHRNVKKVFYPEAESFDQKELYHKYMRGAGGLFSFQAKTEDRSKYQEFIRRCRIFQNAVSWGGYESLVYSVGAVKAPVTPLGNAIMHGGVMRMYTGLENTDDLLCDIEQALKAFD
jgi:cystathionine beta-lyase/cystathionine gamma-synthase